MKSKLFFLILILSFIVSLPLSAGKGQHKGESVMLDANIEFLNPSGKTLTDAQGIHFHYYGRVVHEDKVYPSKYWGEYPLYFINQTAGIKVRVTNKGPRAKAKIRVKTEAHVLKPDGSNGISLAPPKTTEVEIARGETKTVDASISIKDQPGLESGLNRFLVKVVHPNEGGGPGNSEPALIMQKEGVFCPPK